MYTFLSLIGAQNISPTVVWFMLGLAFTIACAVAWLADAIMDEGSFGIIGNTLIIAAGALGVAILWHQMRWPVQHEFALVFGLAMALGSVSLLLGLVFARRFG